MILLLLVQLPLTRFNVAWLRKRYLSFITICYAFTQLLGIALRADIPLALDLLPCFWKSLLNLSLDPHDDLRETDILTYNYLRRFSEVTQTFFRLVRHSTIRRAIAQWAVIGYTFFNVVKWYTCLQPVHCCLLLLFSLFPQTIVSWSESKENLSVKFTVNSKDLTFTICSSRLYT